MNRATIYLTRKDINRNPVGPLVVDMQFVKPITPQYSLYSFSFDTQGYDRLDFMLAGDNCTTLFSLLDEILSPDTTTPNPPTTVLSTADQNGNPKGKLQVTVAKVETFADGTSLFSTASCQTGAPPLSST